MLQLALALFVVEHQGASLVAGGGHHEGCPPRVAIGVDCLELWLVREPQSDMGSPISTCEFPKVRQLGNSLTLL